MEFFTFFVVQHYEKCTHLDDIQDDIPWKNQMKVLSRRGMTVRRSLDLLSKQLDSIQSERNELKNTLSEKEKEICGLLK